MREGPFDGSREGRTPDVRPIAVVLNAPTASPPLRETLQLALTAHAPRNESEADLEATFTRRVASLLTSEPGIGVCDATSRDRVANIVTSAPFFMNGAGLLWRASRAERRASRGDGTHNTAGFEPHHDSHGTHVTDPRKMKRFGWAMLGVGAAAVAYHVSPRERRATRAALRRMDFTSIALASTVASDAYGCRLPAAVKVASVAVAPRFPLLVSGVHCAASEVAFFRAARGERKNEKGGGCGDAWKGSEACKRAHAAHLGAVLGAAFFFMAEEAWPEVPLLHATWHLFGAAAISTGNRVVFGA